MSNKPIIGLNKLIPGVYTVKNRDYRLWVLPDSDFVFDNGRTYKRGLCQWEKLSTGWKRLGNAFIIFPDNTIGSVCDWQENWDEMEFRKVKNSVTITINL